MKKLLVALYGLFCVVQLSVAQVGTWQNYLAYSQVQQIQAAGDDLFVMASNSLYQYNKKDQSVYTYDKTKGLNDVKITNIKWCSQAKRLIVAYDNSNIDLVETNGNVTNINAIYSKVIIGGKNINSITIYNQFAYLACDFGIVKLNVKEEEISETYMLNFPITAVAIDGNNIFAKSKNNGIWTASLSDNLINTNNWKKTTTAPSFTEDKSDYNDNIELVNTLKPGGPKYNFFGFMCFANNQLYTCGGGTTSQSLPACIQLLKENEWTIFQDEGIEEQTGVKYVNITCLDYDPADPMHIFAGSRTGLYEFKNGQFLKHYNDKNSPIESFNAASKDYELVTGVKFDTNGNLWILNSQAPSASLIKFANGEFTKYNKKELMKLDDGGFTGKSNGNLQNMMMAKDGWMWFVNNNWALTAVYRYHPQTDEITAYENIVNQDGVIVVSSPSGTVGCVTEDLEGNIWIGTSSGPLMLEKSQINNDNYYFTQVKVPRNDGTNYADYLLANVEINCIAIDGGGRKWFGTSSQGVYLISADNMEQIQHFTSENSPLLSNNVQSVAINPASGQVFFGTENGLCSYMSDATQTNTEMTKDNVWAYPNPVTPDYTGYITITGLTYNAQVKITTSNGVVVNEGRSNGGSYQWNGCDQKGKRVASGVYMVHTATSEGKKGIVCKIAIVR